MHRPRIRVRQTRNRTTPETKFDTEIEIITATKLSPMGWNGAERNWWYGKGRNRAGDRKSDEMGNETAKDRNGDDMGTAAETET